MALVAGSGAFWTTTKTSTTLATRTTTNNVPTATKFPTTSSNLPTSSNPTNSPPPNASSRHRSTSDSSDALYSQSHSSGSTGGHTQNSSSPSSSSSAVAAVATAGARRRRLSKNNVVLHVQHCAFGLQDHVLKRRCRVLHEQLRRLRAAASAGYDRAVKIDDTDDKEEKTSVRPSPLPFMLRLLEPAPRPQGLSQQRVVVRADASGCSCDALPLTTVSCLQHSRTTTNNDEDQGHDERDDDEFKPLGDTQSFTGSSGSSGSCGLSRWREEHSPGKENYNAASSVNAATTPLVRPRASSLRPLPLTAMKPPPSRSVSTVGTQTSPTSKKQMKKQTQKQKKQSSVLHVELIAADASAVAVLLEFLFCGKIASPLPTITTAREVARLCRWLCLENRLLVVMLAQQLQALPALDDEWMDLLLQSARMRSAAARRVLLERSLQRLADLVPTDSYASAVALSALPLHRLAAIEDADVFTTAVLSIFNRVRHLEIWSRLTAAVELWLHWSFRRPMVSLTPPMALRDVHASFAPWEPVISLAPVDVSGLDAYVRPTTLFRIGDAFAFQVRLEPDGLALMHWRVIRINDERDDDEEDEEDEEVGDDDVEMTVLEPEPEQADEHHVRAIATMLQQYERPALSQGRRQQQKKKSTRTRAVGREDPTFTLRGRLCVRFRYGARGPLLQQTVAIRYTHGPKAYGQWHVLLSAASPDAEVIAPPPADPLSVDSESEAPDTQSPEPTAHMTRSEAEAETFELLAARFSGQFFAWGHAVCNLYHYLLLATLFYQAPADAPPQDRVRAAADRMRELPVDTLLVVLASDRLRVPGGETTLVAAVSLLCAAPSPSLSIADMRALFSCVRWCFVELEQIMQTLESSPRALRLYELIESQLGATTAETAVRRVPWGVPPRETPYRANTTLIEFQIEAGDRSLSPSKFLTD